MCLCALCSSRSREDSPVLEAVVDNGLQYQSVTDVRRAPKMEHVDAPQGWVSFTQAATSE